MPAIIEALGPLECLLFSRHSGILSILLAWASKTDACWSMPAQPAGMPCRMPEACLQACRHAGMQACRHAAGSPQASPAGISQASPGCLRIPQASPPTLQASRRQPAGILEPSRSHPAAGECLRIPQAGGAPAPSLGGRISKALSES